MFILETVSCGTIDGIDIMLPNTVSTIVSLIKVIIPIFLVIFGMLDLGKAVMAQKDDEIKKGQKTFFSRVIAAVIIFFVVSVVQLVLGIVGAKQDSNWNCFDCFINGADNCRKA